MANLLLTDAAHTIVPQHATFTYAELCELIAGPLEAIPLTENQVMLVDAAGQRKQLAPNLQATALVQHFLRPGETIAGPALVVTRAEIDEGRALRKEEQETPPYMPDEQEECQENAEEVLYKLYNKRFIVLL